MSNCGVASLRHSIFFITTMNFYYIDRIPSFETRHSSFDIPFVLPIKSPELVVGQSQHLGCFFLVEPGLLQGIFE